MNIEFELKKSPAYKIGKFIGIPLFFLYVYSAFFSIFKFLIPSLKRLIKGTGDAFHYSTLIYALIIAVISIGLLIIFTKPRNKFFRGIKDGFSTIPKFISNVINLIVLSIVYFLGIGLVSIISKISGKHYLDLKKSGSTWVDRSKEKKIEEDNYRQF